MDKAVKINNANKILLISQHNQKLLPVLNSTFKELVMCVKITGVDFNSKQKAVQHINIILSADTLTSIASNVIKGAEILSGLDSNFCQ